MNAPALPDARHLVVVCAVAAAACILIACELSSVLGEPDREACRIEGGGATLPAVGLPSQGVRVALTDLATRVAPSFGPGGAPLADGLHALANAWSAGGDAACRAHADARAALAALPDVPGTAPDRAWIAFVLDLVAAELRER